MLNLSLTDKLGSMLKKRGRNVLCNCRIEHGALMLAEVHSIYCKVKLLDLLKFPYK